MPDILTRGRLRPSLVPPLDTSVSVDALSSAELDSIKEYAYKNPDEFRSILQTVEIDNDIERLVRKIFPTKSPDELLAYFKQPPPAIIGPPRREVTMGPRPEEEELRPYEPSLGERVVQGAKGIGERISGFVFPQAPPETEAIGGALVHRAPITAANLPPREYEPYKAALRLWSSETYEKYKDTPWMKKVLVELPEDASWWDKVLAALAYEGILPEQLEDPQSPLNAAIWASVIFAPAKVLALEKVPSLVQIAKEAPATIPEGLKAAFWEMPKYIPGDLNRISKVVGGKIGNELNRVAEQIASKYRVSPLAGEAGFVGRGEGAYWETLAKRFPTEEAAREAAKEWHKWYGVGVETKFQIGKTKEGYSLSYLQQRLPYPPPVARNFFQRERLYAPTGEPTIVERTAFRAGEKAPEAYPGLAEGAEPAIPAKGVPVVPEIAVIPAGWRTEVGTITIKPGMEEVVTGKAMVDWQRKVIVVSDAKYLHDPAIINEEIAHIRLEELPDAIKRIAISEYEKAAKYTPIEIRSQFARREGFGQDYGKYLVDPSSVTPEIATVFEKYFPAIPKAEGAIPGAVKPVEGVTPRAAPAVEPGAVPKAEAPPVKPPPITEPPKAPIPPEAEVPPPAGPPPPGPPSSPLGIPVPPRPAAPSGKILTDLTDFGTVIDYANKPDIARKIANLPVMKTIMGTYNPAAVADTAVKQSIIGRAMLRAQGSTKATGAFQSLAKFGGQTKVWGPMDTEGRLASGKLKGLSLNDIRTYPKRYWNDLTDTQKAWIDQANNLEKGKLDFLKRNGIEIHELGFEDGGQYAGRRVYAKLTQEGEVLETGYVGAGPGRPGAKLTAEKTRVFKTEDEAIKAGFRYLSDEDALYYNLQGATNRVADKKMAEWLLENIDWRTAKAPPELVIEAAKRKQTLNRSRQLLAALNRAVRGERIPDATINSIARDFPNESQILKLLIPRIQKGEETASLVQSLKAKANTLIAQSQNAYYKAVSQRAKAAEEAGRLKFGEARIQAPAFAGKILTGPDAKETARLLNKSFSPEFNEALGAINKVNALGRFYQLAGDASPMTIQLIFLAGENPRIYAKAGGGFVKALFDPVYHANYLAKHANTIQKAESLILAKSGTEFTEALSRGGLLRKQPFKIGGKILEPFQRAFEVSLDVAGIEMREALEHLATTPERSMQLDQFINEFRGLANSARIGVSPLWRSAETASTLAPRYNRAIAALLTDVVRGNLRGELARRSMAKGIAAIAAMTVAISYARGEDFDEIVSHLNPMSDNFVTWTVAGQRIGPGSKVRSVIKLWANAAKDPSRVADLSVGWGKAEYMRNPFIKFIRANAAPVPSDTWDILTGKNYIGDPTRDGLLSFGKTIGFPFLMPIWVQSMALEGGDIPSRVTRGAAEFMGGRAYPENKIWQLRETWKTALKPYNEIPAEKIEQLKEGVKVSREDYRKRYPDTDAKLFVVGMVTGFQSKSAVGKAIRLIKENEIDPMTITAITKRLEYRKAMRDARKPVTTTTGVDAIIAYFNLSLEEK